MCASGKKETGNSAFSGFEITEFKNNRYQLMVSVTSAS